MNYKLDENYYLCYLHTKGDCKEHVNELTDTNKHKKKNLSYDLYIEYLQ